MNGQNTADIQLRRDGRIATLTICRPARRNALAPRHFRQLAGLIDELEADPGVGAIVLTGEGDKAFCAGADLSQEEGFFAGLAQGGPTGLGDVLRAAHRLSKPLIGRVNGACYAGGVGLLGACDLVAACEEATFALPEVKLGIFPFVVLASLRHRVTPLHLSSLALTGRPIDAATALQIGLVSHLAPRAGLDSLTMSLAEGLASMSARVLRAGLPSTRGQESESYLAALAQAEHQGHALISDNSEAARGARP